MKFWAQIFSRSHIEKSQGKQGCILFRIPPREGGEFFSSHLGRFSSCTGGKRRKKEEKGEKGMKKQKEKRKKEEKGIKGDKKGRKRNE